MCFPEKLAVSVSAVATALAQGKTTDEISLLSNVFVQIGDTLSTIAAAKDICGNAQTDTNLK